MRRNAKSITASADSVRHIEGLTDANFKLLTRLFEWLAANENAQRKFRTAVLGNLAEIHCYLEMIHGAQIVEARGFKPGYEELIQEHAKNAEKFVHQTGEANLRQILSFIYREEPRPEAPRDRRRKWWGWEI